MPFAQTIGCDSVSERDQSVCVYHIIADKCEKTLFHIKIFDKLMCCTVADVDECVTSPCPTAATCLNVPGSFYCQCASGATSPLCDGE
jgi:hypothetical protein